MKAQNKKKSAPEKFYAKLGKRIAKTREGKRVDQSHLAKKVGVSRACMCRYESGGLRVPVWYLYLISQALDCPLIELLCDVETP